MSNLGLFSHGTEFSVWSQNIALLLVVEFHQLSRDGYYSALGHHGKVVPS